MEDSNLTPAQRVWKRRRNRWSRMRATMNMDAVRSRKSNQTWEQAVREGTEATFLKREGEGD